MDLLQLANKFGVYGSIEDLEHITIGHINQTYRVKINGSNYIMQMINKYVFINIAICIIGNIIGTIPISLMFKVNKQVAPLNNEEN